MKVSQKSKQSLKKPMTRVVGIGKLDLNFVLELNEYDENELNISIEDIDSIEKLSFLNDRYDEYKHRIQFSSNNELINTLLYLNKVTLNKHFIEYSGLASISYSDDELFLKKIFDYALEHHFIFIVDNDILPFYKTIVNFSIKKGNNIVNTFSLCQNDNMNSSINNQSKNERSNNDEESLFNRLSINYNNFSYLFIDLNEFVDLGHFNLGFGEIVNLLYNIDKIRKNLAFCIIFPSIISNMNQLNTDSLNQISEIIALSDYVFFDKREAIAYYNLQAQLNSNIYSSGFSSTSSSSVFGSIGGKSKYQFKNLVERNFHMAPFHRSSFGRVNGCDRVGFFFDDLMNVVILESHRDNYEKCTSKEIKLNIIPKFNSANRKLVEECKKQYEINRSFLNSVFLGGFLSKFLLMSGYDYSIFVAEEITRRCLDIFKLGLEFPLDNEFYYVSTKKSSLINVKEKKIQQEKGFVLDCTNVINSKLNEYNPLYDNNLSSFFGSNVVKRHLNEMGFINTRGFILLDTKHKKQSLLVDKSAEKVLKKDKNIMIAVKENSQKMSQENLQKMLHFKSKALNDPSISQLELLAHTLNFSPNKNKQLPSYSESSYFYKPFYYGKVKLQPINTSRDNFNKTSQNVSISKQSGEVFSDFGRGKIIIIIFKLMKIKIRKKR